MEEEKQICYPYAYGKLNACLDWLVSGLERDCMCEFIDVDDRVFELLKARIEKIQKAAVLDSYDKH
jgi:hypothetical protein